LEEVENYFRGFIEKKEIIVPFLGCQNRKPRRGGRDIRTGIQRIMYPRATRLNIIICPHFLGEEKNHMHQMAIEMARKKREESLAI